MASAYSIVKNYGNYIEPFDLGLLAKGLEYKQGKYDENAAAIQSKIDEVANMDLVRDVDKQYLNDRIDGVLSDINKFGSLDLSKNSVTRALKTNLTGVMDDNVMNAYVASQNFRKYQKEVEYYKKEKPEMYSEENEMFGMRGVEKWLQDPSVGAKYSGGDYTPYTDVNKKVTAVMDDMVKNRPEQMVSIPTGDGRIIQKKVKELTAHEIRTVALGTLSPQDKKQMRINGWYNFGQDDPKTSESYLQQHLKNKNTVFDANLSKLDLQIAGAQSAEQKSALQAQRKQVAAEKNQYTTAISNMDKTPENIGAFLEQEALVANMTNRYGFKEVQVELKSDTAFFETQKFNYKIKKDERDYEFNVEKFEWEKEKFRAENGTGGLDGSGAVQTDLGNQYGNYKDAETTIMDNVTNLEVQKSGKINEVINSWTDTQKAQYNNVLAGTKKQYPHLSDQEAQETAFDSVTKNSNLLSKEQAFELQKINDGINQNQALIHEAHKSATEIDDNTASEFFDILMTKPNIKSLDGSTYAQKYAGKKFHQLSRDEQAEIKSHIHGDTAVSTFLQNEPNVHTNDTIYHSSSTYKLELPALKSSVLSSSQAFGENLRFEDLFIASEVSSGVGYGKGGIQDTMALKLNPKHKGTKTYQMYEKMFANKAYDTSSGFRDDSFQDVSRIRSKVSYEATQEAYGLALQGTMSNLPANKATTFAPKSSAHKRLSQLASSVGGFKVTSSDALTISPNPNDEQTMIITQQQGTDSKGKAKPAKQMIISKKNLMENGFGEIMNFDNTQPEMRANNMQPRKEQVLFIPDTEEDVDWIYDELDAAGNPQLKDFVTAQGTENYFYDNYSPMFNQGESGALVKDVIDHFVANTGSSSIEVKPNRDKTRLRMNMVDSGDNVIMSKDIGSTFDEHYKSYTVAPQAYGGAYMNEMLQEAINSYTKYGQISNNSAIMKYARANGIR